MKLLVTGGGGFVMAHVVHKWLERVPDAQAVIFDAIPLEPVVEAHLARHADRFTYIQGDVTDAAAWKNVPPDVDHVVHGAAVTPHPTRTRDGGWRHPERENPELVLRVNIMGAVAALEWARRLESLKSFINVSSGSVYAQSQPGWPVEPLGEGEWLGPEALYDITKRTAEQIGSRYRALFGMPVNSVRFSTVFGPLDRITPYRAVQCIPNKLAAAALAGTPIGIRSTQTTGDFISAVDVAEAVVRMLLAPREALHHEIYNVAAGYPTSIGRVADLVRHCAGRLTVVENPDGEADIELPREMSTGRYGAYDISRIACDLSWRPRPLETMIAEYVDWLVAATSPEHPKRAEGAIR